MRSNDKRGQQERVEVKAKKKQIIEETCVES